MKAQSPQNNARPTSQGTTDPLKAIQTEIDKVLNRTEPPHDASTMCIFYEETLDRISKIIRQQRDEAQKD